MRLSEFGTAIWMLIVIASLVALNLVYKTRKMKALASRPISTYPSLWPYWVFGDTYFGTSYEGLKVAKIGVLETGHPRVFDEITVPWESSDWSFYPYSIWAGDQRHATAVASVISWLDGGLLYNSRPYWVGFDVTPNDPTDFDGPLGFLAQKGVEVANVSLEAEKDPWEPPAAVELAFDNRTWLRGRPLFVFAAGNDPNDQITQRSWNGIVVGSPNYYKYSWKNPTSLWSDRELPEVVAAAEYYLPFYNGSVVTDYPQRFEGTSFAAPVFTSLAGLISHTRKVMGKPAPYAETMRAIIYASGEDATPPTWKYMFPYYRFGYYKDYTSGTGEVRQGNAIDIVNESTWDYVWVNSSSYVYHSKPIQVRSGESIRAAIAWSQPVSCASDFTSCDCLDGELVHDFDLYLQEASSPYGPWVTPSVFTAGRSSFRNDSTWELIDASNLNPSKYYRLRATLSVNGSFKYTFMGIAWRKH